MTEKNTKYLYTKYPELFKGQFDPITENLMCFGLDCMDGWKDLIDELCEKITTYCKQKEYEIPKLLQVKEKYGSLRIYMNSYTDNYVEDLISDYEAKSSETCEHCGKSAKIKNINNWLMCVCNECEKKIKKTG